MSTETIRLIRDREKGGRGYGGGVREIINLSLHCHNQNDSCIKMDSDEIHLNVSLTVRDKVTKLSTDHNFWRERRAEVDSNQGPSAYQPNALPLGQTSSRKTLRADKTCYVCKAITSKGRQTKPKRITILVTVTCVSCAHLLLLSVQLKALIQWHGHQLLGTWPNLAHWCMIHHVFFIILYHSV